jgi:alanyl-tRNA synthetase
MPLTTYEREPYLTRTESLIEKTGAEKNRIYAVLADTIFYPEGGGQPADRGTINGIAVLDVQKREGEIRHYLASPLEPGPASLELDWRRRFDHMQQHTGQHLLTAVAQDRLGWPTTSFHLGETTCDIEVDAPSITPEQIEELEDAVAAEIRTARPVHVRYVEPAEMESLGVRTRGLPEGFSGDIRLVEISGIDLNTCGGTHLRSTSEIELIKLIGKESIRGGSRLFFVAGGRARRRFGADEARNAELRTILGTADNELTQTARARLDEVRQLSRTVRDLEEELLTLHLESLLKEDGPVTCAGFDGRDGAFLQKLCRAFSEAAGPERVLFASSSGESSVLFALALGKGSTRDGGLLVKEIAPLLGGRGGGSGLVFQGKGTRPPGIPEVKNRLAEIVSLNR